MNQTPNLEHKMRKILPKLFHFKILKPIWIEVIMTHYITRLQMIASILTTMTQLEASEV